MKILTFKDYREMSERAAEMILRQVRRKKKSVLGLATGSTPIGMYDAIAKAGADFSGVESVNLDEYVGLPAEHDQSYAYFMREHLFSRINIDLARTHVPSGTAENIEEECKTYDALLNRLGRIDIQVLGLGHNGHIGFNEPNDCFEKNTHVVELDESTISANARFFTSSDEVPRRAITMGIQPILCARNVLVLVSGESKAEIVKRAFTGPVTPHVPASILQLHPSVTVMGDKDALKLLNL